MDIKRIGISAAVLVAVAVGGFAGGRYAAPDKVVVTEKVVTVDKVVTVSDTDRILNAIATAKSDVNRQNDVHKKTTTVKKPDGTVVTVVTTDDKSKTDTKTETKTETQDKEKTHQEQVHETVVTKEVTKLVERHRPDWALTLSPGFDFAGALGHGSPYSILPTDRYVLKHLVIGASIERRLIGPLSTGVWANTAGAGGVSFRLEF